MKLDNSYYNKLYSGILGKIIGVYVGRPFEGWIYEEISEKFGEINRYVHEQIGHPLIVSDDDITGTFMFTHALQEHGYRSDFSSKHIGQSWLDNLIENKTILWWGGYGQSTEHTAWLNLKNGIEAPHSGSIAVNGKTVAEQIGAQIFIDGWALINPGNPDKAVALAKEAGSVSHDGEAVYAACVIAAMEAQAFVETDLNKLIDLGLSYIPTDSDVARVITDVREWHEQDPTDWKAAFAKLKGNYGYDKYDGTCHVMPNHGLIILSLLFGGESFHESMKIVNTLGWDTDCNAANVGCLNGIRLGIDALDDGYDWRGPIADRILLPSANIQDHIFDAVQEADKLLEIATFANTGKRLPRTPRFHFTPQGSVQGFALDKNPDYAPNCFLENKNEALAVEFRQLVEGVPLRFKTATHTPQDSKVNESSYHIVGSPSLYSGQQVNATVSLDESANYDVNVCIYVEIYDSQLNIETLFSEKVTISAQQSATLNWTIPALKNQMIANVGLSVTSTQGRAQKGTVYLEQLDWTGTPSLTIGMDKKPINDIWGSSWINTMDTCIKFDNQDIYRLVNNDANSPGVYVYGSNDWQNYELAIKLTPQIKQSFGPIVRYQGLSRFYRITLNSDDTVQLVRESYGHSEVIFTAPFQWSAHKAYNFKIQVNKNEVICFIDDQLVLQATDTQAPTSFASGGAGFYNQLGPVHFTNLSIRPL